MPKLSLWKRLLPWRKKGYKVLGNFPADNPAQGDELVLQQMLARGADLSRPRHVVHYLYFPDDDVRSTAEASLRLKGYETRYGVEGPPPLTKSLIAERTGIVNDSEIAKEREMLEAIAEATQGEYDGWEAQLD